LYCALSQPSEKLIFIYAEADANGKPLRAAPIIMKIRKMFPGLQTAHAPVPFEKAAEESIFFAPFVLSSAEKKQTLHTAATRLENFARCPFAYYVNYILRAKPRKLYEILPTDLGGLFHDVIAEFTKQKNFELSRTEIDAQINALVNALQPEDSIFSATARNKHILNKVRRVAAASCWALCEQIKRENFRPELIEQEILANIALDNERNLSLFGRIDRVDILRSGENEHIKIIDYKSGNAKFSAEDALKGVQLQLMLYMNAITKNRANAVPAGVFYFPIDDPIINADVLLSDAAREEALLKSFKLSGIEVGDVNDFENFSREVESKVKQIGTRMLRGEIAAAPYTRGTKCPCNFCEFKTSGLCPEPL
jgi:ATP-dependent helicase/DNAse subunit B